MSRQSHGIFGIFNRDAGARPRISHAYQEKEKFFDFSQSKQMGNIARLAGTKKFKKQIVADATEEEIRKSWKPGLSEYKKMRQKYLIYP